MDPLFPTAENAIEFEAKQRLFSQTRTRQRLHLTFGDAIRHAGNEPASAAAENNPSSRTREDHLKKNPA
jgi:hypothetical protein